MCRRVEAMITYSSNTKPERRIDRVRFYVPSTEEIRKQSVVEITESTIWTRGLPSPGSLQDIKMGTGAFPTRAISSTRSRLS